MSLHRRGLLHGAAALALARAGLAGAAPAGSAPLALRPTGDVGALAVVDAALGDRPWRCLIDTGASVAVVSPAVAEAMSLKVKATSRVATAGGVVELKRVAMPAMTLAGERVDPGDALVLDLAQTLGDAADGVDGLAGMAALRDRGARLDLAGGRFAWSNAAAARATVAARWPLRLDGGLPVVELQLAGRPPAPFLLDTGNAGALVVFARHAERLVPDRDALPRMTLRELGGEVTVHPALLSRLAAPGFTARDVPVVFEAGARARRGAHFDRLAGSLGLALFAPGAVTIDAPAGELVIELPGLPEPPPLPGGFGLVLQGGSAGDAPKVQAVYAGSAAERAGVLPGWALSTLDDADLRGVASTEVWRRLQGRDAARFGFDARPQPLTLARERFFARWP